MARAGATCATNPDDCANRTNPCQHGGTCVDLVGGHECECNAGYRGSTCGEVAVRASAVVQGQLTSAQFAAAVLARWRATEPTVCLRIAASPRHHTHGRPVVNIRLFSPGAQASRAGRAVAVSSLLTTASVSSNLAGTSLEQWGEGSQQRGAFVASVLAAVGLPASAVRTPRSCLPAGRTSHTRPCC